MADLAPILTVPTAFNSLDQAVYTASAGYPSSAWLLRQMARNDRFNFAQLRHGRVEAFPLADLPRAADYVGTDLGTWPIWTTSYLQQIQWTIWALIPNGETVGVTTYDAARGALNPYRGRNDAATMTGNGTAKKYTAVTVNVIPGDRMVGLVLHCDFTGTTPVEAGAGWVTGGQLVAAASGAFAFVSSPPRHCVQLYDAGTGNSYTGWHQIIDVRDSGRETAGAPWTDDVAIVHPPFDPAEIPGGGGALNWRVQENTYADIYSIAMREVPLSGDLGVLR